MSKKSKALGHSTCQECGATGAIGAVEEQKPFAALPLRLAFLFDFQLPPAAEVGVVGCCTKRALLRTQSIYS